VITLVQRYEGYCQYYYTFQTTKAQFRYLRQCEFVCVCVCVYVDLKVERRCEKGETMSKFLFQFCICFPRKLLTLKFT